MKMDLKEVIPSIKSSTLKELDFLKNISDNEIIKAQKRIDEINLSEEALKEKLEDLGEVKKLLIKLKNSKMHEKKDFILTTINTALADVFLDQNIKIDLVASNTNKEAAKLNIKYDIVLYQNGLEMARNEKLLVKNGGGVLSFISILFKILVGYIYSRNTLYIFDESLAEVSEMYRPRMAQFIQKFCEVHKFTIILITQTSDIAEFADLVYYLDGDFVKGIPTLKIDKVDGEYPEENYIYTKIENFQSIKKLEFRYKGFTAVIGKNNIGKSASFRAINSIIFNNFDMKEYPRMMSADKPDKLLATRIEFGKFTTKDDPKNSETQIAMYKKGASLIYEFNGHTFVGKNLAFEKVKEKIEEIGFRYLNLKEQYKNFRGNLKDQTERLAITTQQDTYYLIGGKTSETSKVFDFLFDSRDVTIAINNLNADILEAEQLLNSNITEVINLCKIIDLEKAKINFILLTYRIKLIEEIFNVDYDLRFLTEEEVILIKRKEVIGKIINVSTILNNINISHIESKNLEVREKTLHIKKGYITKLINNLHLQNMVGGILGLHKSLSFNNLRDRYLKNNLKINFIRTYLSIINYSQTVLNKEQFLLKKKEVFVKFIQNLKVTNLIEQIFWVKGEIQLLDEKIEHLNTKKLYIQKYIKNDQYITSLKQIIENIKINTQTLNNYNQSIVLLRQQLEELPKKYGLSKCNYCNGYGIHKH